MLKTVNDLRRTLLSRCWGNSSKLDSVAADKHSSYSWLLEQFATRSLNLSLGTLPSSSAEAVGLTRPGMEPNLFQMDGLISSLFWTGAAFWGPSLPLSGNPEDWSSPVFLSTWTGRSNVPSTDSVPSLLTGLLESLFCCSVLGSWDPTIFGSTTFPLWTCWLLPTTCTRRQLLALTGRLGKEIDWLQQFTAVPCLYPTELNNAERLFPW